MAYKWGRVEIFIFGGEVENMEENDSSISPSPLYLIALLDDEATGLRSCILYPALSLVSRKGSWKYTSQTSISMSTDAF